MKLPADVPWLNDAGALALCSTLESAGFQALFVGGCVRNAVMGIAASDIDIATDATPDEVQKVCKAAGFKTIPTGIDHGTLTVVIGSEPYEVTTFRNDVTTNGRHAVVAFSTHVVEDARRRDFTMNALYARSDGTLVDPLGGLPDALARRVIFINDAAARIREDYLRILRFFRFSAWYADPVHGFDADALAAIAEHLDGLAQLSAERVGSEMTKLLGAPDPAPAVAVMERVGVLPRLLCGAQARWLAPLIHAESMLDLSPDPMRRLVVLGGEDVAERLRLSKADARKTQLLGELVGTAVGAAELGYRYGLATALDVIALRAALFETPLNKGDAAAATRGSAAKFPVAAHDLMPALHGPALGAKLKELETRWIASGFILTRAQLLG
ncbi:MULTISPECIES: CCA tRNA nucleotidyltransferase [Roseobacteraceae]|jgi:tRNA nucleotidyltransferase/poly(A) polymerase|uniref:CCA-adding enzyme n=2 Tax=Pseudosulfitobacter pseudonitzschiae TaxID=1402135 RepID=A0A221K4Y4_9RHOB|nr:MULTISPECIES: CCA tRNA nucleotidyltransferase [Roseobacteraceae]ASM73940.1 CCA-adding enzyme [Pseudosulfitobacter pseudonitzschiae]